MAAGLIIMGIGNYWMSQMNLDISSWQVVWPRCVVIGGLSMVFAPLNVAAFLYIPPQLRGAAVGLLALLRNEGGSVGTSVAQTIHERRDQLHSLQLGENLDKLNPARWHAICGADPHGACWTQSEVFWRWLRRDVLRSYLQPVYWPEWNRRARHLARQRSCSLWCSSSRPNCSRPKS
jgi:hypothetical protein